MSHGIHNVYHDSFICAHISISYWIGGSSRILPASSQLLVDSCAVTHSFMYGCHGWIPPIRELIHICVTWLVHIRFKKEAAERHGCSLRMCAHMNESWDTHSYVRDMTGSHQIQKWSCGKTRLLTSFQKKLMWTSHVTHIRMSQGIHFSRISEQWWRRRENTTTRVDKKNKCGSAMTPIHKWMISAHESMSNCEDAGRTYDYSRWPKNKCTSVMTPIYA